MTNDERSNDIQRLADRHQDVLHQLAHLGREIEAVNSQMTPDLQQWLVKASTEAERSIRFVG